MTLRSAGRLRNTPASGCPVFYSSLNDTVDLVYCNPTSLLSCISCCLIFHFIDLSILLLIFGFFVAVFPYCSYGFPEWTCLPLGAAAPIALACVWPVFVHFKWMRSFVKALLSGGIKEFSKGNHKWDGPYKAKAA